jgi:N-acetylmuramoyl-L-alanine amidase
MLLFARFLIILSLFFNASSAYADNFLSVEEEEDTTIFTLKLGNIENHKVFFLSNPERLVVDLPMTQMPAVSLPSNYKGRLIGKVRAAHFNPETIRIVFDLNTESSLVAKSQGDGELTITIAAGKNATHTKEKIKPQKPMVVIDPGHGGDDPGAIGPKGSQEKDIVLTFAKSLEDALKKSGKYRVLLTRDRDLFIPLRERVSIARHAKASIFISIHADSAPGNDARGLSIYTLSEKASDAETEALAARENKVDILGGMDLSNERQDVADILISLAQRETRNQSALLADLLTVSLGKNVNLLNNPHRFAGFAVLKAPDVPSVLIETGFISHKSEEKLLKTRDYRQRLVSGIVKGIDNYFAKQGNITP